MRECFIDGTTTLSKNQDNFWKRKLTFCPLELNYNKGVRARQQTASNLHEQFKI